jgi:hypothetical protein
MFTQEKQDLINKKDWKSLLRTDILDELNDHNNSEFRKYVFDFDFIYEFVLKRFNEIKSTTNKTVSFRYISKNMFFRAKELNLNITANQWGLIVNEFFKIKKNKANDISSLDINTFLDNENKNSEYIKFIINCKNPEFYELFQVVKRSITFNSFNSEGSSVNDFIALFDAFETIYKNNRSFHTIEFYFDDKTINRLLKEFKTDDELVSFFNKGNIPLENAIKTFSEDRFISFIRKNLKIIESTDVLLYVKSHRDMILPDDLVKTIFEENKLNNFASILTLEQTEKYKNQIDIYGMVFNKRIPLDKVKEFKSVEFFDVSKIRFFTEEEIIQNPAFFDPESVKNVGHLYISESTFALLNKTWGKKQKYDNNLSKFSSLFESLASLQYFSIDILRYLIRKTGINNTELVNAISSSYLNPKLENFNFIKEFINSY